MPRHPYKMIAYRNNCIINKLEKFMKSEDYIKEYTIEEMEALIRYAYKNSISISKELREI